MRNFLFLGTFLGSMAIIFMGASTNIVGKAAFYGYSCPPTEPVVTRGAYLQMLTDSSVLVRWRTDVATNSAVFYGDAANNLTLAKIDTVTTTEHIVKVDSLLPNTRYYYAFGTTTDTLQGDTSHYFFTAPPIGTEKITRIWVTGDCGTGYSTQLLVQNAYQNFMGSRPTDLWLLLGDNAYQSGFDAEYQTNFFEPYMSGRIMRKTPIFPAPGNHDYYNTPDLNSLTTPYFQSFSLPTQGEIGGVPSNTEAYYSFDYANIHFVSLNSYGEVANKKMYDTTSAQIQWLKQDLAANQQKWTMVYWHHPPYTMCSHNSDTENDLVAIRENVVKILDRYKVDLVLCGHSHCYERSKLMRGHYGMENTFDSSLHHSSTSSAHYDGSSNSCPYVKSSSSATNEGIIYVVAGSAGKLSGTQIAYPHNAMYTGVTSISGSFYIEVDANRLDAKFITQFGFISDKFTILKDINQTLDTTICRGSTIDLSASWKGQYFWQTTQEQTRQITVSPTTTSTYLVTDGTLNCLTDTIQVNVSPSITADPVVYQNCTYQYSTPLLPNANYLWTITGGTIMAGQGTANVEVIWDTEGAGAISVDVSY